MIKQSNGPGRTPAPQAETPGSKPNSGRVVEIAFGKRAAAPRTMSDHGWYHEAAVADARAGTPPRRR